VRAYRERSLEKLAEAKSRLSEYHNQEGYTGMRKFCEKGVIMQGAALEDEMVLGDEAGSVVVDREVFEGCGTSIKMTAQGHVTAEAIFPDFQNASSAARFAAGTLGGYWAVRLSAADGQAPTHATWEDWAFEI
jgi:hypothetical protein